MSWWEAVLDLFGVLILVPLLAFVFLFVRRRWISRNGGTFECSVRTRVPGTGKVAGPRGWTLGLARYAGETLEWFRVFSFSARPKYVLSRSIVVVDRRTPQGAEAYSLYSGHVVVEARQATGRSIELAMSQNALTGFLAWTEAAPPGHDRLRS